MDSALFTSFFNRLFKVLRSIRKQPCGKIPFAGIREQDNDTLSGKLLPPGDLTGGKEGGSTGNTDEQTFFTRGGARRFSGIVRTDGNDFVDDGGVQYIRDNPGTDTLKFMHSGINPAQIP